MNKQARGAIGMAIATLVEAFRVKSEDMTPVRIRIYSQALGKVPTALLEPMTQRAISTRTPRWGDLPSVAELLADAEHCRRELLALHAWAPCAECEGQAGWVEIDVQGVKRLTRCVCVRVHRAKLEGLGVTSAPLALPPAREFVQVADGEDR